MKNLNWEIFVPFSKITQKKKSFHIFKNFEIENVGNVKISVQYWKLPFVLLTKNSNELKRFKFLPHNLIEEIRGSYFFAT